MVGVLSDARFEPVYRGKKSMKPAAATAFLYKFLRRLLLEAIETIFDVV